MQLVSFITHLADMITHLVSLMMHLANRVKQHYYTSIGGELCTDTA
jgi:hypothetical protein